MRRSARRTRHRDAGRGMFDLEPCRHHVRRATAEAICIASAFRVPVVVRALQIFKSLLQRSVRRLSFATHGAATVADHHRNDRIDADALAPTICVPPSSEIETPTQFVTASQLQQTEPSAQSTHLVHGMNDHDNQFRLPARSGFLKDRLEGGARRLVSDAERLRGGPQRVPRYQAKDKACLRGRQTELGPEKSGLRHRGHVPWFQASAEQSSGGHLPIGSCASTGNVPADRRGRPRYFSGPRAFVSGGFTLLIVPRLANE